MKLELIALNDPNILMKINNEAVPHTPLLTVAQAKWLVEHLAMPGLALLDGEVAGVLIVLNDNCGYDSDSYRWFTARYVGFLYVARVIVSYLARRQDVATQLYEAVDQIAEEKQLAIAAEIYSDPSNTIALSLYLRMGYEKVGSQYMPIAMKTVSKFMKYEERVKRKR
jgi:predicted GNAT superfamily acetyltransferase